MEMGFPSATSGTMRFSPSTPTAFELGGGLNFGGSESKSFITSASLNLLQGKLTHNIQLDSLVHTPLQRLIPTLTRKDDPVHVLCDIYLQ